MSILPVNRSFAVTKRSVCSQWVERVVRSGEAMEATSRLDREAMERVDREVMDRDTVGREAMEIKLRNRQTDNEVRRAQ